MKAMHHAIRKLRNARGATMIEAALVTPLLLLLTFSIADFGSLFYVDLALENGASQATRYGVTGNLMDDPAKAGSKLTRTGSIMAAMRDATPTLTIPDTAFTFSHLPAGSTSWVSGTGNPGDIEKLTIDYDYSLMTPLLRPFFTDGMIHFQVQSTMKNEDRFK